MSETVPDSERVGLIGALPAPLRPYASLIRLDRPIGTWLLFWPCAWGTALAGEGFDWRLLLLFAIGAFAMRSAGCVYNDIVDRDLDRRVERTRLRPLASGRVGVRSAWTLLVALSLIGLAVLLQLPRTAQVVALISLMLVAAYPFMKRWTWWPQAWLGLVFSWGALVGWAAAEHARDWPALALWLGSVAWVVGYDTIYAIQDIEDDALAGVKSSARRLSGGVRRGVAILYVLALAGWFAAVWLVFPDPVALLALLPVAAQLGWQAMRVDPADGAGALALFRSNRFTGLLAFLAFLTVGLSAST
ncbi:4-hydroxybenzoate octaprenyltransferase [Sphingomonas mesophila]|uniref:4-hydroxybenzoate octaprenyltransferase n=1 Tax=Sphingomonas mesophila TaxID=2303576 RepID=UPI000E57673A|nr:4-hydroxybenzoate octaprenyltransferase [Sphingomonas mesophila]